MIFAVVLLATFVSDSDRVLVVANSNSPVSETVAKYYCAKRGVKSMFEVKCVDSALNATNESIQYSDYLTQIEKPISEYLGQHAQIDYIVLTKGIPIRILNSPGRGLANKQPSLDSTLASLGYDKLPTSVTVAINDSGFLGTCYVNRFWNPKSRFTHAEYGGYLVCRLDGYSESDAKALVDRSVAADQAKSTGAFLIDISSGKGDADITIQPRPPVGPADKSGKPTLGDVGYNDFNADMRKAADKLVGRAFKVEMEETEAFVGDRKGLAGYVSWGSNDGKFEAKAYHSLGFGPGAICETAVSTSGRTFLPTTGGQSLIADLISQGVSGAKGYTDEPLLAAIASPSILFERYTRGWNLAESYYAASRMLGWEDIVIGDPLCCPYKK